MAPLPVLFEDPYISPTTGGHLAHNNGLDIDIGLCYTNFYGDDGGTAHKVISSLCTNNPLQTVNAAILNQAACDQRGKMQAHGYTRSDRTFVATHYHIRFIGSHDIVPGC